jgi:hypothetical protein
MIHYRVPLVSVPLPMMVYVANWRALRGEFVTTSNKIKKGRPFLTAPLGVST